MPSHLRAQGFLQPTLTSGEGAHGPVQGQGTADPELARASPSCHNPHHKAPGPEVPVPLHCHSCPLRLLPRQFELHQRQGVFSSLRVSATHTGSSSGCPARLHSQEQGLNLVEGD